MLTCLSLSSSPAQELSGRLCEAKEEAEEADRKWGEEFQQAQNKSEQRVKSSTENALNEARHTHQRLLQKLFPEVSVACSGEADHWDEWLEEFAGEAQKLMEARLKEVRKTVQNIHKFL